MLSWDRPLVPTRVQNLTQMVGTARTALARGTVFLLCRAFIPLPSYRWPKTTTSVSSRSFPSVFRPSSLCLPSGHVSQLPDLPRPPI